MQTLKLTHQILDWKPNIADIGDRLIMGPQRNVLEKVQAVNNRYGLNLGITRTYRWSPGYMDQVKEWMSHRYIQPHMKRKISTFFNQIDNKQWSYRDFRDKLNSIENELCSMRSRKQTFQDNSEIVERVYSAFIDKLKDQLKGNEDYFNVYVGHHAFDATSYQRYNEDIDRKYIVFVFELPETKCNYYIGGTAYPIPIYSVTMHYAIEFDELLYRLSGNIDWIEDESLPVLTNTRYYGNNGPTTACNAWRGTYHRNYINETSHRDSYGNLQLLHPYISNEEYSRTVTRLKDMDGVLYNHAYACMGGFQTSLSDDLKYLKLGQIYATLYNWHTVFNSTSTQPMNPVANMFYGKHQFMDDVFANVVNINQDKCRIASSSTTGPKTYCDNYECEYRKTCSYYTQDGGELADEDDELEVIIEEHNRINRELGLTNNGEELASDYREEMDMVNGDLPHPELEENLEERIIAWASQHGGAINIATNNERNSNG